MRSTQYLAAVAALVAPTLAQTFTPCQPLEKTCPANPALGKSVAYDFTKGAPTGFTAAAGKAPIFNSSGAYFSITKNGEAPTLSSDWFIMFGHVKVVMKPAPGAGIVSSVVLQSHDLDEVDWEWIGSETGKVQTNYYGKGNTTVYDRGATLNDGTNSDGFNTYEIDWTAEKLEWIINKKTIRTLTPATADYNQYPQSPMQFKLGNWAGGESESAGTRDWAGGRVDWSQQPFNMIVKSVEVSDYSTGKSYSYSDKTGNWQSIRSEGGKISGSGTVPDNVSTASASGSKITASPTAGALDSQLPVTASTTKTEQLASGAAAPTGSGNATVNTSPTTAGTSPTPSTSAGAGSFVKPAAGLAAAGLLAVIAL